MGKSAALILFFQSITFGHASLTNYNIADLEVLKRDKNFEEFLLHVNDIRPSERGRRWREMFQSMSMEFVDYKIKTRDFSLKTYKRIEEIGRSSALNDDEFFQLKRSLFAKKFFTECFHKASNEEEKLSCSSELTSFWYFSKKDPDIGLDLATIIESNKAAIPTWPFYEKAVKDSIANLYCKKPAIQSAILNKLNQETFSSEFSGNYKGLVNRILPESCFLEMVRPLKSLLSSIKSNGVEKEMAFNILEAKGLLTSDEIDLYAVLYLLDGPVVGDKMNTAWKKIELLGENFSKRQKLLSQIEALPLIPDKIFKDPNLPRHKAIINLFAQNFPEYLDYYSKTCLKYITNSGSTLLNISSSFQCNEFLKAAQSFKKENTSKATQWISDSVDRQYSSLKK